MCKQMMKLEHHAHRPVQLAETRQTPRPKTNVADMYLTRVDGIETADRAEQARFTGSGYAHERQQLAGPG